MRKFQINLKKCTAVLLSFFCINCFLTAEMSTTQARLNREKFVAEIKQYIGKPYKIGAVGPDEFDCSGLVYYTAAKSIGVQLPRTSRAIYNFVKIVPEKNREIGDLLFFKTTDSGLITHVGVYIGNNQFISAISDGPNTGVIVSSLNQDYWKKRYSATGQFIAAANIEDIIEEEEPIVRETASVAKESDSKSSKKDKEVKTSKISAKSSYKKEEGSFQENFIMDASLFIDWSLITPRSFTFKFRGVDLGLNARYAKWEMEPGVGLGFRYNYGLGIFQMPITVSLTINDYFRTYAGPVISFGRTVLIDTEKEIKPSVFPGVIGVSFSTNQIPIGKTNLQFTQDISYTIYNNIDGSALSFIESVSAGFVFYTGVKVSLPLSVITG